jgi:DtxR family Mn-dependent transcriptional regulator
VLPSLTVENYVKTIFLACTHNGDQPAATGQVAAALRVSPGTVTSMLKTLSDGGLVEYTRYEGVLLTPAGRQLALRVLRRHRLIELFLVKTLGLAWDEVHEEAEHMEHAVSDRLIDRLDEYLGHPEFDPHGDPIPRADGSFIDRESRLLADCRAGEKFRLARVLDQSPEFLRYLSETRLALGTQGAVVSNKVEAGTITIRLAGQDITLGRPTAEKIQVQTIAGE